jgi:hypothetical protein
LTQKKKEYEIIFFVFFIAKIFYLKEREPLC